MPIHNHLIVGLGGTGGNMLYAFRRLLFNKYRAFEPPTANIRYLYIDSSNIDIQSLAKNYPVLGGNTRLPDTSVQAIPGNVGLRAILDNPNAYPTVSSWLGGRENFESILNSVQAGRTEAAQIRRLGRVLFTQSAGAIRHLQQGAQSGSRADARTLSGAAQSDRGDGVRDVFVVVTESY